MKIAYCCRLSVCLIHWFIIFFPFFFFCCTSASGWHNTNVKCFVVDLFVCTLFTESMNITFSTDVFENGNLLVLLFVDLISTLTDGNIAFESFEFQISNAAKQFMLIWIFYIFNSMQRAIEMCIVHSLRIIIVFNVYAKSFSVEFQFGCVSNVGLRVQCSWVYE